MIVVRQVRKSFEGREVLAGIDLRFEPGVSVLLGPSGGGKSTLLRCINGLERFESGAIDVGDLTLGTPTRGDARLLLAVRRKVGMVFQHYGLFAHMTALANVMEAPVVVKSLTKAEAREQACALLEKVGLTHRRDAFPRELSGGEQQRVAIARALAMAPEALLLDEPTSALDPSLKAALGSLLGELGAEGTVVVMVTHEPHVVRDVATRAFALEAGRVVRQGTMTEVLGAPWQP